MATKRQAARALAGSIEKWRAIVEKRGDDNGASNCPLCAVFVEKQFNCRGCPVSEAGHDRCDTGPYDHWFGHHTKKHTRGWPMEIECGTCTRLAKAELKFLESLVEAKP